MAGPWPPCSLGSPATATRAGKSGQVALPAMAMAARQEAPGGLRVEENGKGTEGVDMLPLCLLPMISSSVRPSSTGPKAVPFSTVPSVIQATGTSCLESHKSLQTALSVGSLLPTVHSQHSSQTELLKIEITS